MVSAYSGDWIVRGIRRFMVCGQPDFDVRYEITEAETADA